AESHTEAGAMFFHFLKFVEVANPSVVVIENVPEYANTASMEVIRSVLASLEYQVQERVFDSTDFGSIQRRKRLCVVAVSNGLDLGLVLDAIQGHQTAPASIGDILDPVPVDSVRWSTFDYLAEKEARDNQLGKFFVRQLLHGHERHCGTIGKDY